MLIDSIFLPPNPKTISCVTKYHADDVWLTSFRTHAETAIQDICAIAEEWQQELSAEEIMHRAAMRIKRHAIYQDTWENCPDCKFERMDKYIYERGN